MTPLNPVELIERKRDGGVLSMPEYEFLVRGLLDGGVSDAQTAAWMMAGLLNGFTAAEASALTQVMLRSGDVLDLSDLSGPTVDKHSTGGVGDGTTLVVAPLLAATGAQVVKLSGRGLGHTGGTLDKLESIPGMRVQLTRAEVLRNAEDVGCVVAAQTGELVPADKAMYALRDVTGTVPSTALIASSVMSKKLASSSEVIVLDVKAGDGAFMGTAADALALAELCVSIGESAGRRTRAIVSDMDTPLGTGIGNALEVIEVVELLQRPPEGRFGEVSLTLTALGLSEALQIDEREARERAEQAWASGAALERLRAMIVAQGGDPAVCDKPREVMPSAPHVGAALAGRSGVVNRLPARAVGLLSMSLGAGRQQKTDEVDPAVGIELLVREGDSVESGQPLARVHARDATAAAQVADRLVSLVQIEDDGVAAQTVLHRV